MNTENLSFSPHTIARLHGLDMLRVTFSPGSTPDFVIWTTGYEWGHLQPGRVTRFDSETRTHRLLKELPGRREEFNAFLNKAGIRCAKEY